jgi:hypothetical protein
MLLTRLHHFPEVVDRGATAEFQGYMLKSRVCLCEVRDQGKVGEKKEASPLSGHL